MAATPIAPETLSPRPSPEEALRELARLLARRAVRKQYGATPAED